MAAVIFTRTQIATFATVVTAAVGALFAVPSPYAEGIRIDSRTGAGVPDAWHRLQAARSTGDAASALHGLRQLLAAMPDAVLVERAIALLQRELEPLELQPIAEPAATAAALAPALAAAASDQTGDAVEAFFAGSARGIGAVDSRASELHRRMSTPLPPSLGELLALAGDFGRRGRTRAQWRWLVRAFALHPESVVAVDSIVAVQLARGRLAEALAVTTAGTADRIGDRAFWRRRAQLGAWLGRADVESEALELLVAMQPDAADRGRLIELWTFRGEPQKALPHAMALADGAAEIAEAEVAAKSALAAGYVDEGLGMLARAASRAVDPTPWLVRLVDYAEQDLRLDVVRDGLERVAAIDPSADDHRLEAVYRRLDRPAELAELLQRRLARTPDDRALWNEVVALRYALGDPQLARTLAMQREVALADPAAFLQQLPPELRSAAADARRQALSLALAGTDEGTIVGDVLERLRPFLQLPEFRAAAETLLQRHKRDPRSKPMRIDLLDFGRTPLEAERAAAALCSDYDDDVELVKLWIDRASWADQPLRQQEARQRLYALQPGDRDNRHALADLLDMHGERAAAIELWRGLVRDEGTRSKAAVRLVDALFASGAEDEALALLQRLAADPEATTEQRLQAAEELFFRRGYDRAKVLYNAVLATEPDQPKALLRLGQICAWSNDPRGARPFFERRLKVTEDDGALVRFYLGETLWALGEPERARVLQQQSLDALQRVEHPDFTTQSLVATMLARLGRRSEAAAAYRGLVGRDPRDLDLTLDYLDVVVADGRFAEADMLLRHGRALSADAPRLLRLEGELQSRRGDYAAADRAYSRAIELYGATAGICSDQGQVRYQSGDWEGALASFSRWLQLQQDSAAARRQVGALRDELATAAIADVRMLRLGDDRVVESTIGAVLPFDDRRRLHLRAGRGHYRGRAAAAGPTPVARDVGILDVGFEWRPGTFDRFAVGTTLRPGADGDLPVGLFAAAHLQRNDPFESLELRLSLHEPWTEPAAAVALGGRRSSLEVQGYRELGGDFWAIGGGSLEQLGIDPDGAAARRDLRAREELSIGCRVIDGDVAVAGPFTPLKSPSGPSTPGLLVEPAASRAWLGNVWLTWQGAQILDDADLPSALPLRTHDGHLYAAGRLDRYLMTGFGVSVAAHGGIDLVGNGSIFGFEAAMTWRPSATVELTLSGSHGTALGRSGGGDVDELRLEGVLRW